MCILIIQKYIISIHFLRGNPPIAHSHNSSKIKQMGFSLNDFWLHLFPLRDKSTARETERQREKPSERNWVSGANEGKRTKLSEAEWAERTKVSERRWANKGERSWVSGANEGKRTKVSETEWAERTKASERRWAKLSEWSERRQANKGERNWVSGTNEGKRTKVSERMERSEKIDGNNRNEFIEK